MPKVTQEKLRRLAPRAVAVLAQHKSAASWMAAFEGTLGVSAVEFQRLYEQVHALALMRKMAAKTTRAASLELRRELMGWANVVALQIRTVKRKEFLDNRFVANDVITDVAHLIGIVTGTERATGETFPFSDAMRTELAAGVERLRQELDHLDDIKSRYSRDRAELRAVSARLTRDLIAFRFNLGKLQGTGHPDYQRLRFSRKKASTGGEAEEESEEEIEDAED